MNSLPEKSLNLMANTGKKSDGINSYSVCIYELEYPEIPKAEVNLTRNFAVMNIKDEKGTSFRIFTERENAVEISSYAKIKN